MHIYIHTVCVIMEEKGLSVPCPQAAPSYTPRVPRSPLRWQAKLYIYTYVYAHIYAYSVCVSG